MKTLIIVDSLSFEEKNYEIIKTINSFVRDNIDDVSVSCFNLTHKVINTEFAVFNPSEVACFYDGLMISTSIETAECAIKTCNNSQHVLYLWGIDFLYSPYDYILVYDIIHSQKVFVRSEEHSKILNKLFGIDCTVLEFNLEKIWNSL